MADKWEARREALGAFIREQRQQARLSLRQLAEMTSLSNPYLSQVERGLHQPSIRALKAISDALNLSAETLLAQAGLIDAIADRGATEKATGMASEDAARLPETERAISADPRLSEDQKAALLTVYRSMVSPGSSAGSSAPGPASPGASAPGASPSGNI
jgi:transcriptional regulator with XRE-family HTH domain